MQVSNKTFIAMNLASEICSYCSISRFLTSIVRFCTFPQYFFLQDCEVNKKVLLLWVFIFSYTTFLVEKLLFHALVAVLCHE